MGTGMKNSAQRRAIESYRQRLGDRGLRRFEVVGLDADKELIRSLSKRLAENNNEAARLRTELGRLQSKPRKGGILAALRASPLVGANLEFKREKSPGRDIKL